MKVYKSVEPLSVGVHPYLSLNFLKIRFFNYTLFYIFLAGGDATSSMDPVGVGIYLYS